MVIDDPSLTEQIDTSIAALRKYFIHPEFKALLEMVGPDGEFIDTCNGRVINPGHCIETAWFIIVIGIRTYFSWLFRFLIGLGSGDGTRNSEELSISVTVGIFLFRTILRI